MGLDNIIYKVKQLLRKALPLVLIALVLYGAYNVYRRGSLSRGLKYTATSVLRKIPFIGSKFGHSSSYSYSGRGHRHHHGRYRHHRRHHR